MWGYIDCKNSLKHAAGCASVASSLCCGPNRGARTCIFNYHRVVDLGELRSRIDSWNVGLEAFERQAQWLATEVDCVPLESLLDGLRSQGKKAKPRIALSFDDGYANFRHNVLPVLQRYSLPATVSVVTAYVGSASPFPFDSWGQEIRSRAEPLTWRPISWVELEECIGTGLVSVGSHSHNHFAASACTDENLVEEALKSREIIQRRLGAEQARIFAYPYGFSSAGHVPPSYVAAVQRAGYQMALTTNLGLVHMDSSPFLLPRIEAHGWDSAAILRAKANGYLAAFRLLQGLRKKRHFGEQQVTGQVGLQW